ncbi:hypothetical protein [Streptomyces sp. B4I13]|uniref:hypothetical protein n=1 Tax=Streptomyces sp. B4I13 TaxID=3042271 RepID=UPI0027D7F195|nr:hypothetical protein [Streptomyces sp. B4I13]
MIVRTLPAAVAVLDGTRPADIENRISALRAAARGLAPFGFLHEVPVFAAPLTDPLRHSPSATRMAPRPGPWQ